MKRGRREGGAGRGGCPSSFLQTECQQTNAKSSTARDHSRETREILSKLSASTWKHDARTRHQTARQRAASEKRGTAVLSPACCKLPGEQTEPVCRCVDTFGSYDASITLATPASTKCMRLVPCACRLHFSISAFQQLFLQAYDTRKQRIQLCGGCDA